jgi:hemoglobin/transferrin/lactoferrin receptor protein
MDETTNLFANYSRGFRLNAPNFGIWLVHNRAYRVPNPFLDPVIADQFEIGVKESGDGYEAELATYYTLIRNQQREEFTTFQGSDFLDEYGNGVQDPGELPFIEITAGGKATLKGIEFSAKTELDAVTEWFGFGDVVGPGWSLRGGFAWEIGYDRGIDEPMQFVHPAFGVAAVRYDVPSVEHPSWVELAGTFVRRFDRVVGGQEDDPAWLDDPQDPNSGPLRDYVGVPGYAVLDLRGGVDLSSSTTLTLGIENLTDRRYRSAHSRMDAPGINFFASLDMWF